MKEISNENSNLFKKISNSEYNKDEKHLDLYPASITKPYLSSSVSLYTPNKPLSPSISDRKHSQQEPSLIHITNTPPPFPKLQHNQPIQSTDGEFSLTKTPHDYELFIFSSVNSCDICHAKFKSTSKYIGLKCKNCHLNCHEQCSNESSYNECKSTYNVAKNNIWESLIYPKTNLTESVIDNTRSMSQHLSNDVQLDTSVYSTHTTSSCSTTPSSQYSHQQISNSIRNQNSFANHGRFDSDIGSVSGKKFLIFNSGRKTKKKIFNINM